MGKWILDYDERPNADWRNIHILENVEPYNRICFMSIGPNTEKNAMLIAAAPELQEALAAMLDSFGGYCSPEVDQAITVMQEIGCDRWSMESQMKQQKES